MSRARGIPLVFGKTCFKKAVAAQEAHAPSLALRQWSCIVEAQADLACVTANGFAEVRAALLEGWHGQFHGQGHRSGSRFGNRDSLVAQASSPA
jgi:hypothetical protein